MYSKPTRTFNVISVINIIILFHLLSLPSLNDNLMPFQNLNKKQGFLVIVAGGNTGRIIFKNLMFRIFIISGQKLYPFSTKNGKKEF